MSAPGTSVMHTLISPTHQSQHSEGEQGHTLSGNLWQMCFLHSKLPLEGLIGDKAKNNIAFLMVSFEDFFFAYTRFVSFL